MDPNKVTQLANENLARKIGFLLMAEAQNEAEKAVMFEEITRLGQQTKDAQMETGEQAP